MYLHIGKDTAVDMQDVIAVLDMDKTTVSHKSRKFLQEAEKRGEVVDITEDLPQSYIIAEYRGQRKVYISSLAPQTIVRRIKNKKT